MASQTSSSSSAGIGFFGLLTIVFVTLKLLDKIDWSWWWVLAPLWMPWAVLIFGLLVWLTNQVGQTPSKNRQRL